MNYKKQLAKWKKERYKFYKLYRSGMSMIAIAKKYHKSRQAIQKLILKVKKEKNEV